jgi:hypothetical protein
MTEITVSAVFGETIDQRTRVVFAELLRVAIKHASLHPDRDVIDLISRARSISASFDKPSVK